MNFFRNFPLLGKIIFYPGEQLFIDPVELEEYDECQSYQGREETHEQPDSKERLCGLCGMGNVAEYSQYPSGGCAGNARAKLHSHSAC